MLIAPFYSPSRGIALEDLWHDQDECPIGRSIALADRRPGTNHSKRCPYCALLDKRPTGTNFKRVLPPAESSGGG